jgi:hypothetical protein
MKQQPIDRHIVPIGLSSFRANNDHRSSTYTFQINWHDTGTKKTASKEETFDCNCISMRCWIGSTTSSVHCLSIYLFPVRHRRYIARLSICFQYDIAGTLFVYLFVSSKTSPVHCLSIYLFPVRHRRYIDRLSICFQ